MKPALIAVATAALAVGTARAAPVPIRGRMLGGEPRVALAELARHYGARARRSADGRMALYGPAFSLTLDADGRRIALMGVQLWLPGGPVLTTGRGVYLHRDDVERLIDPIARPSLHLADRRADVVALDPGHGGRDGGAVGHGDLVEKNLTIEVARAVRARLAVAGLKVVIVRDGDEFVELDDRAHRAAALEADVFVSIHFNSATVVSRGIETFVLAPPPARAASSRAGTHDGANAVLGFHLQKHLVRRTGAVDRGLRQARFAVLRGAPCAAALVECGFLSDPDESRRIADPAYRDRIAEGIARGILEYVVAVRRARAARVGAL